MGVPITTEVPYQAFSGANMHVTVGPRRVGTLQGITVSITREVAALYGFGSADPMAFVRGKRGIAGSMVFTQFDRHALLRDVFRESFNEQLQTNPLFDGGSLFGTIAGNAENLLGGARVPTRDFTHNVRQAAVGAFGADTNQELLDEIQDVYKMVKEQRLRYSDQIPEFDVTITMINEAGHAAVCSVLGIVLVNEGWSYTLDDLVSESAFTFVAKGISPLTSLTDVAAPSRESFRSLVNIPQMRA